MLGFAALGQFALGQSKTAALFAPAAAYSAVGGAAVLSVRVAGASAAYAPAGQGAAFVAGCPPSRRRSL